MVCRGTHCGGDCVFLKVRRSIKRKKEKLRINNAAINLLNQWRGIFWCSVLYAACLEDFPMLGCKGVLERLGSWQQSLLSVLDPKSPSPSRDMGYTWGWWWIVEFECVFCVIWCVWWKREAGV